MLSPLFGFCIPFHAVKNDASAKAYLFSLSLDDVRRLCSAIILDICHSFMKGKNRSYCPILAIKSAFSYLPFFDVLCTVGG